jgi:hypothetical protein
VLDVNAYRSLGDGARFPALLEAERHRGVAPYADPWVLMELLGHLADSADPDYKYCRGAVRRIYERCAPKGDGSPCGLINDSESQITRLITEKPLPGHEEATAHIGDVCAAVAGTPLGEPLTALEPALNYYKEHTAKIEQWFADHFRAQRAIKDEVLGRIKDEDERKKMRRVAMRELDESEAIRTGLVEAIIRGAFKDVGLPVPDPIDPEMVKAVRRTIPVGIEFHVQMMRTAIYDEANLDSARIRNLMWDERISYAIGQELDGGPVWFVTDDPKFAAAALAAGYGDRVLTLAAYERWLGIGA